MIPVNNQNRKNKLPHGGKIDQLMKPDVHTFFYC